MQADELTFIDYTDMVSTWLVEEFVRSD